MLPIRQLALCGLVPLLATPLAAQRTPPAPRGQRAPTVPRAEAPQPDTAQPRDSLTRLIESVPIRAIGPAAYAGRITAIAVPRTSEPRPRTMYVGSAGGGVWKTTNGGVTWQSASNGLGSESIGDLAVAPSDSSVLFAGTGEANSLRSAYWGDGMYRSANGGRSWTRVGLEDTRSIGRVVVHPTNPDIVYVAALGHLWGAGGERGVFKTTDGGRSWTRVLFVNDTSGAVDLEMDPSDPEVLYAATWHRLRFGGGRMQGAGAGSGIHKTTDGGRTWTRLTDPALANGLPTERMGRIGLAVSPQDPRIVYATIQVDRGITDASVTRYGGVFRSGDAGRTWTQVNDLASTPHYFYGSIWADPSDSNHVAFASVLMYRSRDGGRTFAADSTSRVHVDHHAFWFDPNDPAHWVLGNDGGLYQTYDRGRTWWHNPFPVGQFYTVIVDSSHTPYQICGGLQDNGTWCGPSRTRDNAGIPDAAWYPVVGGDGMWVQVPANDPFTVYTGYQFGSYSRLDLRTWQRETITPQSLDAGAEAGYAFTWGWTAPLLLSAHDQEVLYLGSNRLFRLRRGGRDWEILGPDMTRTPRENPAPEAGHTSYHAIFSIAESPRTPAVLWTGTDDGHIWVSQDTGRTWANVTGNLPRGAPVNCWVATIAASYHAEGAAYAALDCHHRDDYRPHVWATTDFGRTWTEIGRGLPRDRGSLTVLEDVRNPRLLFVGTSNGVWVTPDRGARWHRLGRSIPNVLVHRMALSFRDRELVVATHGRGLYVASIAALQDLTDSALAGPAALFSVSPAYDHRPRGLRPSDGQFPFAGQNPPFGAVFQYWLREAQPEGVRFVITNPAGDTVRTLTGPGYPGLQRVTWDLLRDHPRPRELGGPTSAPELRRLPPGEYVVRASVGGRRMEQRFTVVEWPRDPLGRLW